MGSSYLSGVASFKIIVEQSEIDRIAKRITGSANKAALGICDDLATAAAEYLKSFYGGIGHDYLAPKWVSSGAKVVGRGAEAVVYNTAEDEIFNDREPRHDGTVDPEWAIKGSELIKILEYGAGPHEFGARNGGRLSFKGTIGVHASIFAGTVRSDAVRKTNSKGGLGAFLFKSNGDDGIFPLLVNHPGVKGNEFIKITREMLLEKLAEVAAKRMSQIDISTI